MLIPRRSVRTSQPQGPAWLKRNGSLISGLSVAYVPSIGRDLVHDVTPVTSGMARGINTSGVAIRNNGSGGYVQFTDTPLAGDIVIGCVFTVTRTDAVQLLVARVREAAPYPQNYVLGVYAGELYFGMSADSYAKITCPISANTIYSALATFSADTKVWSLFVDGKLVATRTGTSNPDAAASGQETRIGKNNGGLYPVYGDINLAYIGSKCPSSPAARSLSANHWQIFEDEEDYLFIPAAGGGGALALDAASGSFALTGVAATLAKHGLLSASAGSYAISGQASTLAAHRKLNAASGSYILTGASAGLTKHLLVNAAPGSVTISAIDATLVYTPSSPTPVLNAEAGTIGLSGLAASLSAHRVINAGNGSVSLSGASAELLYTALERSLNAGAGSVTVTGAAANLVYTGLNGLTLTQADIDAIAAAVLAALNATTGTRTVGQHLQIQTAVLAGNETGAGTTHVTFTDGTAVVEADVPLPGAIGNRTNVTTSV